MQSCRSSLPALVLCLLASCSSEPEKTRALGEAYVGAATVEMRSDVSQRSTVTATVKHGEKLDVLATRRRFVKVRNMGGTEGWVDGRTLLSSAQMHEVNKTL